MRSKLLSFLAVAVLAVSQGCSGAEFLVQVYEEGQIREACEGNLDNQYPDEPLSDLDYNRKVLCIQDYSKATDACLNTFSANAKVLVSKKLFIPSDVRDEGRCQLVYLPYMGSNALSCIKCLWPK